MSSRWQVSWQSTHSPHFFIVHFADRIKVEKMRYDTDILIITKKERIFYENDFFMGYIWGCHDQL